MMMTVKILSASFYFPLHKDAHRVQVILFYSLQSILNLLGH